MRDSPARLAVLGLLAERPSHPYGVAVRFGQRVGPPWEIHRGQVSQAIYGLERDGLVERVEESDSDNAPKVFRATASGEEVFEGWLASEAGATPSPVRNPLFIRLAFLRAEHVPGLLDSVAEREKAVLARIQKYASAYPEVEEPAAEPEWAEVGLHLILEGGVASLQAELRWLRRVRGALESSLSSGGTAAKP